eukprot:7391974-Prymnesium_polylepis.1
MEDSDLGAVRVSASLVREVLELLDKLLAPGVGGIERLVVRVDERAQPVDALAPPERLLLLGVRKRLELIPQLRVDQPLQRPAVLDRLEAFDESLDGAVAVPRHSGEQLRLALLDEVARVPYAVVLAPRVLFERTEPTEAEGWVFPPLQRLRSMVVGVGDHRLVDVLQSLILQLHILRIAHSNVESQGKLGVQAADVAVVPGLCGIAE